MTISKDRKEKDMTTRNEYIKPEIVEAPYNQPLMVIGGSAGADATLPGNEVNVFSKEFDDFEENDSYEDELWENEREGFGLQDWDTNYEQ